jgi:predicted ATP-binding protein involved in virulence
MKIRSLQFEGVGVFSDVVLKFPAGGREDRAEIHIFTGENGTGKTTILMALAGVFDSFDTFQSDAPRRLNNNLRKRFWLVDNDGNVAKSAYRAFFEKSVNGVEIFGDPQRPLLTAYRPEGDIENYAELLNLSMNPDVPLSFGVFAYSGYRHIDANEFVAVGTPSTLNPLAESLDFVKRRNQSNGLTISNWIANTISKSAVERERDPEKSRKFASAVSSLENALSQITGWKVEFSLNTEPFNVLLKLNGKDLDFDVLPDGLRSLISWIGDLLMRVDSLKWKDDLPAFEKKLILLLDEIEVHLHPAWQRKVLPVVQKLFKNSQIFVSTHSPFVVNSVDGAWVYRLKVEDGKAHVDPPIPSEDGNSYRYILREIFDIKEDFGVGAQKQLKDFSDLRDQILRGKNGAAEQYKAELKQLAQDLASQSVELNTIVQFELRQLSKNIGEEISI